MSAPPVPLATPRQITGNSPALPTFANATLGIEPGIGVPSMNLQGKQILGLIPMYPCDSNECRETCDNICGGYKNPVFGVTNAGLATYENDFNSFYQNFPIVKNVTSGFTVTWTIEKYENGAWNTVININSNAYGYYYALGQIFFRPTFTGVQINWGKVLNAEGEGCYRVKVNMSYQTMTWPSYLNEPVPTTYTDCSVSPIFELKEWDCVKAHGTVKFEIWSRGVIGDPYTDFLKHDLCRAVLYDSIRVKGFFGLQKSPTYKTENNKWGTPIQGAIERVRDEQIQQWEYESGLLPEYIHTRFSTFAMMADTMFVSDYNINNSDWNINRKNIVKSEGASYEPEWLDRTADWQKRDKSFVKVQFNRGVQSVEKYNCCASFAVVTNGGVKSRP